MSFLGVESQLMDRLRQRLPPEIFVLAAPDLDAVTAGTQPTPAVYVLYSGGSVAEARHDGLAVRIAQTWTILVAVRNVAQIASGAPARADAGAVADLVLAALLGWQPTATSRPLTLSGAPNPGYTAGYQWVPLQFATELTRRAEPAL